MKSRQIALLFLLVFYSFVFAQKTKQNQRVWFAYTGQYKVAKNLGYHIDGQFRLDNNLERNYQNLFRVGGIYYLTDSKSITGGYAFVSTYLPAYDDYFKENRLWEQFQFTKKWLDNKNTIINRFRLEQRWVEQLSVNVNQGNSSNYQNRFRYLNRNLIPILSLNKSNDEIYAVVQNEIFLIIGTNQINNKFVDQNRFFLGMGLSHSSSIRLEIGYMNHFITSSSSSDIINHTVSLSLMQNLNFQKQ